MVVDGCVDIYYNVYSNIPTHAHIKIILYIHRITMHTDTVCISYAHTCMKLAIYIIHSHNSIYVATSITLIWMIAVADLGGG